MKDYKEIWQKYINDIKNAYETKKRENVFGIYTCFHEESEQFFIDLKNNNNNIISPYEYSKTLYSMAKLTAQYGDISSFTYIKDVNHNETIKKITTATPINDFINGIAYHEDSNDDDTSLPFFRAALDNGYILFCERYVQETMKTNKYIDYYYFFNTYDPSEYFEKDNTDYLLIMRKTIGEYLFNNNSYGYKNVISQDFKCPQIMDILIKSKTINLNNFVEFLYVTDFFDPSDIMFSPNTKQILDNFIEKDIFENIAFKNQLTEYLKNTTATPEEQGKNIINISKKIKLENKLTDKSSNKRKML